MIPRYGKKINGHSLIKYKTVHNAVYRFLKAQRNDSQLIKCCQPSYTKAYAFINHLNNTTYLYCIYICPIS